jgi:hypothetical protein
MAVNGNGVRAGVAMAVALSGGPPCCKPVGDVSRLTVLPAIFTNRYY